jgi:uncharacterized repeat protein (TIGR01451 family)
MTRTTHGAPRRRALIGGAVAGLATALVPAAHAATPATLTLQALEHGYGPVTTTTTSGATVRASIGMFRMSVTPSGGTAVVVRGFCDEPLVGIGGNYAYRVVLKDGADSPDLRTPAYAAVSWLLRSAERLIAAAPDPRLESGALQVAVWQLGGNVVPGAATTSAALNARAAELRALAAGAAAPAPAAGAASAAACASTGTVQVTVTGAPGAAAQVDVPTGRATVATASVVLDRSGSATVAVRSEVPGTSTVRVRVAGGSLTRSARPPQGGPQQTVLVMPRTETVEVPVAFTDCTSTVQPDGDTDVPDLPATPLTPAAGGGPLTPAGGPQAPAAPSAPSSERRELTLRKTAPRRVRLGARITYRLTVANRGTVPIPGVQVRDPIPDGVTLPAGSRAARMLRGGTIVWDVGTLAPGRRRTFDVVVRALADRGGRVCNRASALGEGVATVRATACTSVVGRPRVIVPAVTH